MSTREHLTRLAADALEAESNGQLLEQGWNLVHLSQRVVDAVLPLITEPEQMKGVPEGSILLVEVQAGARAVRWEDGHLHGNLRADSMPMTPDWVIERYGPLTVVWMP